jgi:hypothetical protein
MFGSTILDVAIAIVFIYLLVSLVISAINEFIAGLLKSRAKNLSKGIQELLQDRSENGWVAQLYAHPLIKGLSAPDSKPSYIPHGRLRLRAGLIAPATADEAWTLADLKAGMANLPQPLQRTLTTLLEESQYDTEYLKKQIEIWFNNGMDRASGCDKRKTQWIQFSSWAKSCYPSEHRQCAYRPNAFAVNSRCAPRWLKVPRASSINLEARIGRSKMW